ncbi:CBS domain-containing protein [Loktanella sp. SALINAS62]|uniref:CBS domain-containing protein n=1 Tax=Loktanella sp. SALINAS62 TaxID=2706124 RepID=UPI0032C43A08
MEDLARLIGAAEMQAAAHKSGPATAADIMSQNLITVRPDTSFPEIADLFHRHRFTALPVVGEADRFFGVIFQIHLIDRAREDGRRLNRSFGSAMTRLLDRQREIPVKAADIMSVGGPRATTATPLSSLLPQMADGAVDAVPVLERGRIVGIVTRTDLISALARQSLA